MNSKNLYFTIFSLILLGFISSCAENSNKCRPSYASNIEQLNEKLYDSYANVAVRKNNTTSDNIITPEYFGGSYVKANKLIVMVKNGSPKGIEDIKKRLGTDSNVTFELTICKEEVSLSSSLLHEKTNTHNNNANMLVIFFIICYLLINQLLSMLHLGTL